MTEVGAAVFLGHLSMSWVTDVTEVYKAGASPWKKYSYPLVRCPSRDPLTFFTLSFSLFVVRFVEPRRATMTCMHTAFLSCLGKCRSKAWHVNCREKVGTVKRNDRWACIVMRPSDGSYARLGAVQESLKRPGCTTTWDWERVRSLVNIPHSSRLLLSNERTTTPQKDTAKTHPKRHPNLISH